MEELKTDAKRTARFLRVVVVEGIGSTRPWREFIGKLSLPKRDWAVYERRVIANLLYFKANYAIVALLATAPTLVRTPRLVAVAGALAFVWAYTFAIRRRPVWVGKRQLNPQQKLAALAAASVAALLLAGVLGALLYVAAVGAGIVLVHASVRPVNVKSQFNRLGGDGKAAAGAAGGAAPVKFGWQEEAEADAAVAAPRSGKKAAHGPVGGDAEDAFGAAEAAGAVYAPADRPSWAEAAGGAVTTAASTTFRRAATGDNTPRAGYGGEAAAFGGDGAAPAAAWSAAAAAAPVPHGAPPTAAAAAALPRPADVAHPHAH